MFAIEAAETADLPPVIRHASAVGYRRSSAGHFATAERRYCSRARIPALWRRNTINCTDRSCFALPAGNFWRQQ